MHGEGCPALERKQNEPTCWIVVVVRCPCAHRVPPPASTPRSPSDPDGSTARFSSGIPTRIYNASINSDSVLLSLGTSLRSRSSRLKDSRLHSYEKPTYWGLSPSVVLSHSSITNYGPESDDNLIFACRLWKQIGFTQRKPKGAIGTTPWCTKARSRTRAYQLN